MTASIGRLRFLRWMFWLTVLATVVTYIAIVAWSAPAISEQADGLLIFDLRPIGYSFEEATTFRAALSDQGRQFYLAVQHRLDAAYPALLAITTIWAFLVLLPSHRSALLALLLPLSVWVFELKENAAVAVLLKAELQNLTEEVVSHASFYTTLKSVFTAASMGLLLVLISVRAFKMWTRRADKLSK